MSARFRSLEVPLPLATNHLDPLTQANGPDLGYFILRLWMKICREKNYVYIIQGDYKKELFELTSCDVNKIDLFIGLSVNEKLIEVERGEDGIVINSDFLLSKCVGSIDRRRLAVNRASANHKKKLKRIKYGPPKRLAPRRKEAFVPPVEEVHPLIIWANENVPEVMKMKETLTNKVAERLVRALGEEKAKVALSQLNDNCSGIQKIMSGLGPILNKMMSEGK